MYNLMQKKEKKPLRGNLKIEEDEREYRRRGLGVGLLIVKRGGSIARRGGREGVGSRRSKWGEVRRSDLLF